MVHLEYAYVWRALSFLRWDDFEFLVILRQPPGCLGKNIQIGFLMEVRNISPGK